MRADDDDAEFDRLVEAKLAGNRGTQDAIDALIDRRARERVELEEGAGELPDFPTAVVVRDSPEDLEFAYLTAPVIEVDDKTRTELHTAPDGTRFARYSDGSVMMLPDV